MKRCPKCQRTLERSAFGKHAKRYDGLQGNCRECMADYYRRNKSKWAYANEEEAERKRAEARRRRRARGARMGTQPSPGSPAGKALAGSTFVYEEPGAIQTACG